MPGRDDDRDDNPDDPGDGATPTDSSWHGTHCAGTIAAATNNGEGCAGVAPGAKIMPVRVLGRGGGRSEDAIEGILYAAGLENDSGQVPPRRADIISMSLGGLGRSVLMENAVAQARAAGVIVIAAAGNSDMDATLFSPAGEPGVVTVAAVDRQKEKTSYSNYGSVVEVAAPGGVSSDQNFDGVPDNVYSLVWEDEGQTLYKGLSGTSMACPHVAGVAALMKAAYPEMTPQEFDSFIAGSLPDVEPIVEDIGDEGRDELYGYGLINANLAMLAALQRAGSPPTVDTPVVALSVQELDFGLTQDALPLSIENAGSGELTFDSWTASEPWISDILPGPPLNGPQFVYLADDARSTLAEGIHAATLTINTNGGTAQVAVRLVVGDWDIDGGDIGVVYVVLWDADAPADEASVQTVATSISDGFAFELPDVPQGRYRLYAGTDLDNNEYIDDDGEAFGAYPVLNATEVIDLTQAEHVDVANLNFELQFLFNLQAAAASGNGPRRPASPAGGIRRRR
jgi:serine protease